MEVFFGDADYRGYLELVAERAREAKTEVWAYCLMPNHVHLILVPAHEDGLRATVAETHRRYTRRINRREGWQGHLWQDRFHSFAMDDAHLLACARYVELNPVRAGLVKRPEDWPWSSVHAHLGNAEDPLVSPAPPLEGVGDWEAFLGAGLRDAELETLRAHGRTGRPVGDKAFLDRVEALAGRSVRPGKRGPRAISAISGTLFRGRRYFGDSN